MIKIKIVLGVHLGVKYNNERNRKRRAPIAYYYSLTQMLRFPAILSAVAGRGTDCGFRLWLQVGVTSHGGYRL